MKSVELGLGTVYLIDCHLNHLAGCVLDGTCNFALGVTEIMHHTATIFYVQ